MPEVEIEYPIPYEIEIQGWSQEEFERFYERKWK